MTVKLKVVGLIESGTHWEFVRIGKLSETVFVIHPNGEIEINEKFNTTDAAKAFWEAVRAMENVQGSA